MKKKKIKAEKDYVTRKPLIKSTARSILGIEISKKCVTAEDFEGDAMRNAK